jgi:hypothetical protein
MPPSSSLMMEAVRTSETSVYNIFTRHYNQDDSSEHQTRRRENLKSHRPLWNCPFYELANISAHLMNWLFLNFQFYELANISAHFKNWPF